MSRSPSPSRLKQNTAIISASPGKNAIHHSPETFRDHDPPLRRRRPDTKTDEGQTSGVQDRVSHGQRHLDDHDRHDVGQDVPEQDAVLSIAGQSGRLHETGVAADVGLGARHANVEREIHDGRGNDDVLHSVAKRSDDTHRQHE